MKKTKRPNIIFMIADDHRSSDIRALGNENIDTPIFDQLVKEGTSFTNTHIMGGQYRAVCSPARACVHTGGNVFNAVANDPEPEFDDTMNNHTRINPDMKLMPKTFQEYGYYTHAIGKWHNDIEAFNNCFNGGDNLFFGGMSDHYKTPLHSFDSTGNYPLEESGLSNKHSTEAFCDAGVDFINSYEKDSPFFLYMAFTSPHDPRTAPSEYSNLYDPEDIPLPKNFTSIHPFDNGEMHVRDEGLSRLPRDPIAVSRHIADYYAMISHMDAEIGRILNALKKKEIEDNTIIIYTSDHGLAVGQHGLLGKQNLYDHSIKIPLIFQGPCIPSNLQVNNLISQMDIFPTLCELVDIPIPSTVDGKSTKSLMNRETDHHYDSIFAIYKNVQRMVKTNDYKLIRYYKSKNGDSGTDTAQLFNHKFDPLEMNDLSDNPRYSEKYNELLTLLEQWQISLRDPIINI